ncbi:carboxy terminal-processing peptidase [Flavobacterium silvaticum]|uniref:Carboxy terminal-processing peptidase n=1 Tax=Flavobacterium silvaticum TaxID=1852020 RepID=A0A972FTC5_9FLAO|nr:carboxy terminal-processing peptidase [Flavobacterium silvaticum]NMH27185.1 carboxy terminal-processing peptidase [Flavobacterium silvaticum]
MNAMMQFMKRNYKIVLIVAVLAAALWSFMPSKPTSDPEKDKALLELLTFVIERGHYDPAAIDDTFSKGIYKDYITALDPSRRFFLQSDIDEFAKYETQIDDQIKNKDLTFFDLTYNRLMERIKQSKAYYKTVLESPINYKVEEDINTDYEKLPYAKSVDDLKERWRKQVKLSTLSSLADKLDLQEGKAERKPEASLDANDEKPDLAADQKALEKAQSDKKDETVKIEKKSYEELEADTRKSTEKSLNEYFGFIDDLNREDWFAVYINAIASRFDPHTSYFPPDEKERFDVSMSGKLEGIGARLQKKNDFTEITELISGGPAWRGKELEPGDVILKVAQGNKEPVDVVGMRLDDVVKKIKGPKGTEVRLSVKKTDGTMKVISIIRDEVEIEETYAKSTIINRNGMKYGLIYLPKFYIDFDNANSRDAGKDIAQEVERLKKENVQGIILDVRDNGGGSLKTVVDIAGLFIDEGPIVQIKSAGKKKEVLFDKDPKVEYDGPLVIMVNSFSASASEILAAAIQDYHRGVIIGSKQTYGKGTVQNVIDLNQFVRNSDFGDMGALKTTTQKFYRIDGGSTQLNGVSSDIAMPDRYSYVKMGERDIDNAMPWDKIDAADYKLWDKSPNFNQAIANSRKRIEGNQQFKLIDENAKWLNDRSEESVYSLNIDKFRTEQDQLEQKSKKYKVLSDYKNDLTFASLPYEVKAIAADNLLKEKRQRWHESLGKDIYVEEAVNVLDDLQGKPIKPASVAGKKDKLVKS